MGTLRINTWASSMLIGNFIQKTKPVEGHACRCPIQQKRNPRLCSRTFMALCHSDSGTFCSETKPIFIETKAFFFLSKSFRFALKKVYTFLVTNKDIWSQNIFFVCIIRTQMYLHTSCVLNPTRYCISFYLSQYGSMRSLTGKRNPNWESNDKLWCLKVWKQAAKKTHSATEITEKYVDEEWERWKTKCPGNWLKQVVELSEKSQKMVRNIAEQLHLNLHHSSLKWQKHCHQI